MSELIVNLHTEKATNQFGKIISKLIKVGDIIFLSGEMGSGKTFLARSIITSLLKEEIEIPSPTFTIIQEYECKEFTIAHADLYRIKNKNELEALGIDEILEKGSILIEWPEKLKNTYENDTLEIKFLEIKEKKSLSLVNIKGWKKRIEILKSKKYG